MANHSLPFSLSLSLYLSLSLSLCLCLFLSLSLSLSLSLCLSRSLCFQVILPSCYFWVIPRLYKHIATPTVVSLHSLFGLTPPESGLAPKQTKRPGFHLQDMTTQRR